MSSVSQVNGARIKDRPEGKTRSAHVQDRRDWNRGYEDGYYGSEATSDSPWYTHGRQEGAAAARRRDEIRNRAEREDSVRVAAPNAARLLERLAGRA